MRSVTADSWQRTRGRGGGGLAPQSLPSGCRERPSTRPGRGKDAETSMPPPAPLVSTAAPGSPADADASSSLRLLGASLPSGPLGGEGG